MITHTQISILRDKAHMVSLKLKAANDWIDANIGKCDLSAKLSERNLLSVELKTLRAKISNLKNGLPILGYSDRCRHVPIEVVLGTTKARRNG